MYDDDYFKLIRIMAKKQIQHFYLFNIVEENSFYLKKKLKVKPKINFVLIFMSIEEKKSLYLKFVIC